MGKRNVDSVCPKCGGKILIDKDIHGWYEQCLQCSYMRDLVTIHPEVKKPRPGDLAVAEPVTEDPMSTY